MAATAATVTVTGKYGSGLTATATVIRNVASVRFDATNGMLFVEGAANNGQVQEFDISAATTLTGTISSGNFTFVIS